MPQLARLPGLRRLPQLAGSIHEDVVLFDSWAGQFSDNPRAVSEELQRRGTGLRHVWVLHPDLEKEVPDWVEPVTPGSAQHLAMMGRARYLVANNTMPGYHHKRRGTIFMQTWHGAPLKRVGRDIKDPGAERQARAAIGPNVGNWDFLLSPSTFSTPIFREAFGYDGEILETGYPRNDLLVGNRGAEVRLRARERIGVAGETPVVLYAPTFRDNAPFARETDVERLARDLSDSHVVLLRTHKSDAGQLKLGSDAAYRDVSAYPDNRELYLAADVLVTDYSSVMFDFAVTRKPIVFFTPDLERYRDELRGFYFDFESEAPGPLVSTVEELASAIRNPATDLAAYDAFVARYCDLDDGRASERVVDALLAA